MRTIGSLFSIRTFVISLASISALVTASAIPARSDSITLARRNPVTVGGKSGTTGERLSSEAHLKSTVHRLDTWDGHDKPNAVVKTYNNGAKVSQKEVDGLKAAGQYIHHDDHSVVMKEVHGVPLSDHVRAIKDHGERAKYVNEMKGKVADHVAQIAKDHGIMHKDLNMNNVIIHPEGHVQLVDWEHHAMKGEAGFTDNKDDIHKNLDLVWDSTQTPPEARKSKSRSPSPPLGRRSLKRRQVSYERIY